VDRLDRYTLASAEPEALHRLARFVKIDPSKCTCPQCTAELIELLVRKLDEMYLRG
jgi:hypothetical protein